MSYLIDTNVVSELCKGPRADAGVLGWYSSIEDDDIFLSVLVLGELRRGVENVRRRDATSATALDRWLDQIEEDHRERILPITPAIADIWGRFNVPDPLPTIDSLLAATAHVHRLTVVTRNAKDFTRTGVPILDPFDKSSIAG